MSPEACRILYQAWREVSRHLALEESIGALRDVVAGHGGPGGLLVRRWEPERERLSTVAWAGVDAGATRTSVPTPRRLELLRWASARGVTRWASREQTALGRLLVPEGVVGPVVAVPLDEGGRLLGVGLWVGEARPEVPFAELAETMATALVNDARLHELARLREAAEQDRRALLDRLGRADVSEAIVGADTGLREVLDRVDQVAPTDAPVLVLGETGTGKEVVARAVHQRSRRATGPFLRVNCGAIPTELVDSELFGHERGAFTGAIHARKGWFERADGGTLFLDEIGELPPAAQVRLLRVLQDGTFERVGGQETHSADVRLVAATHRDMAGLVAAGAFRQDLWYRISVFPVRLPALRQRPGDIPLLVAHFAERAGLRLFGRPLVASAADIARLVAYPWPGNVRELAAVIERAAILGDGQGLAVERALGGVAEAPAPPSGGEADERARVVAALERCRGRIEGPFGAAAALGVNPHTLRSRLRRLGIDWAALRPGARG